MRLEGKLPSEIKDLLDLPTTHAVFEFLEGRYAFEATFISDTERKSLLALEMARLDKLQAACWPSAMMGDLRSVDTCVKIIQTRSRLAGLDQADPVIQKNLVLVMGEKEEDYIAALKAAASD